MQKTPTDPPGEEPAPPGDPIRMVLGALVASCYAGYRRAKQVTPGPAQPAGGVGEAPEAAAGAPAEDGTSPTGLPKTRPAS